MLAWVAGALSLPGPPLDDDDARLIKKWEKNFKKSTREIYNTGATAMEQADGDARPPGLPETHWRKRLERFLLAPRTTAFLNALLMFDIVLVIIGNQVELYDLTEIKDEMADRCAATNILSSDYFQVNGSTACGASGGASSGGPAPPQMDCSADLSESVAATLLAISIIEILLFTVFLLEHVLMMATFQKKYFTNVFFILDLIAVALSLVFEILIVLSKSTLPMGLLVVMRAWRFIRVADHSMINRRVGRIVQHKKKVIRMKMTRDLALQNLRLCKNGSAYDFNETLENVGGIKRGTLHALSCAGSFFFVCASPVSGPLLRVCASLRRTCVLPCASFEPRTWDWQDRACWTTPPRGRPRTDS